MKLGEECTEAAVQEFWFCKGRIAHFKVPQYLTVTGKIQKYKMREIDVADRGLQSAADIQTA